RAVAGRFPVTDLASRLDETAGAFMDTAAVLKNLDLVITGDVSIAHLAGALGVPVWVALPFVPDWRWLLDREDSPWYPTARLFRQEHFGDWPGVLRAVSDGLGALRSVKSQPVLAMPQRADPSRLLGHASALHQKGELAEAERICSDIVQDEPGRLDACHLLGVIRLQRGDAQQAVELITSVLQHRPGVAQAHLNLGIALGIL